MRFFKHKFQNGDTRERNKFLWFPTVMFSGNGYRETAWFETVKIKEEYFEGDWHILSCYFK